MKIFSNMKAKLNKRMNKKGGFTLVEVLAVVALIGILFVVFIPRLDFATDKVRETGIMSDFRSYQLAIEQVARENGTFKLKDDSNGSKLLKAINSNLDKELRLTGDSADAATISAKDPWGKEYVFKFDEDNDKIYIVSEGADKESDDSNLTTDLPKLIAGETLTTPDGATADNYVLCVDANGTDGSIDTNTAGLSSNIDR